MAGGSWIRIGAIEAGLDSKSIDKAIKNTVGEKAERITQHKALRKKIGQFFVNEATQFVPKKTGELRRSGKSTDDGRVYWSIKRGYNYANKQYNTQYKHYTTPNTGPYWAGRVAANENNSYVYFLQRIKPFIIKEFNK